MPTYVITAPDGQEYEVTAPEGASQEDVLNYAKQNYKGASKSQTTTNQSDAETARLTRQAVKETPPASMVEQMFGLGSPTARFIKGAVVNPLLGVNQLVANAIPFDNPITRGANQNVRAYEQATQEARQRVGSEGFDFFETAGSVFSPINKLAPSGAATTAGRMAQGAGAGALYGAITPTTAEDFASQKVGQMALGGVVGGTVPLTVDVVKRVKDMVSQLPIGKEHVQREVIKRLQEYTKEDRGTIIKALKDAEEVVPGSRPTVSEALADTPTGVSLIKEQSRVAREAATAPQFIQRGQEQASARMSELERTLGTKDTLTALQDARTKVTAPMREQALKYADVYGETAPKILKAIEHATRAAKEHRVSWLPVEKQSETFQNIAKNKAFKQAQYQSLAENGFFPLESRQLIQQIDESLSKVGERSNELLVHAQQGLSRRLKTLTDENGIIKSQDLYNIRKSIGEDLSEYLTAKGNPSFSAEATAVETALKKRIDELINKASGGTLWTDYLNNFAKYSRKIDQVKVGQELQKKLGTALDDKEAAGIFANAVREAPTTLKRVTGAPRYSEMSEVLTPEQTASVNRVLADLSRKAKAKQLDLSAKAQETGAKTDIEKLNFLSRTWTVTKEVLGSLRKGTETQVDKKIAELMLEPQRMADFLSNVPKKDASKIAGAIMSRMSPKAAEEFRMFLAAGTPESGAMTRVLTQQGDNDQGQ